MSVPYKVILCLISCLSLAIGIYIARNPASAIALQKKFYARINWNIEPISMPKEIGNTRLMGMFLVLCASCAVLYLTIALLH